MWWNLWVAAMTRWWPQEEWNAHGGASGNVAGYVPRSDEHWWIPAPDLPGWWLRAAGGWAGCYLERTPNGVAGLHFGWGLLAGSSMGR